MKKILNRGLISIEGEAYFNLIIIIAPLLNFLSGISIDLYVPSLPDISLYFNSSAMMIKNSITVGMIGFAIGCILFGAIIDIFGRRRTVLLGLLIFTLASFSIIYCQNIEQFMLLRLLQGLAVSVVSIGSRAFIIDNFTGHRFNVGLLYTSIAYGLGPVLGPFIGGMLQYHFGWKANFWAFGIFSFVLMLICFLFIHESIKVRKRFSLKEVLLNYGAVLRHALFMSGVLIMVGVQVELMTYPTIGSFFVQNVLHRTAIAFGNTALMISAGYLLGTIASRFLMKKLTLDHLINLGFILLLISLGVQIGFVLRGAVNLFALTFPIMLMSFSNGLIFPNVLGRCLKLFPNSVGVATAVMLSLLMALSAVGVFLISHVAINNLNNLAFILGAIIIFQLVVFGIQAKLNQ